MNITNYLVFTRYQLSIDETMIFNMQIFSINDNQRDFNKFINVICGLSHKNRSFVNVYEIINNNGCFGLNKIAWIKLGELFTF